MADTIKGKHLIFRPWRRTKNGGKIYAKNYGISAFPIWVDDSDGQKAIEE